MRGILVDIGACLIVAAAVLLALAAWAWLLGQMADGLIYSP